MMYGNTWKCKLYLVVSNFSTKKFEMFQYVALDIDKKNSNDELFN